MRLWDVYIYGSKMFRLFSIFPVEAERAEQALDETAREYQFDDYADWLAEGRKLLVALPFPDSPDHDRAVRLQHMFALARQYSEFEARDEHERRERQAVAA